MKGCASGCEERLLDLLKADEPRQKACGELQALASRLTEALGPELEKEGIQLETRASSLVVTLPESLFRSNSAELTDSVRALLKKLGPTLKEAAAKQVAVAGFAPAPGPAKKGQSPPPPWALGASRAARVAAALEAAGVGTGSLSAAGFALARREAPKPPAVALSIAPAELPGCEATPPVPER
ncbi:MAG: OmpA family protein [Deltaproteobacteria bacterium]|nr:OmpA family protein [Deltaproteobacteria bacterium]